MRRVKAVPTLVVIVMTCGLFAAAQEAFDLRAMAKQMRENQEEIRRYSWDEKIVYSVDGVVKRTDAYSVRYNDLGFLERMQTASTVDKEKVRFPDGKKLKKNDREAAYEFVRKAKEQLDAYLNPLFAEKAVASATATPDGDDLVLNAENIVTTGDTVEVRLVQSSRRPLSMSVTTVIEGSDLTLEATFGSMEYGPNYVVNSVTETSWRGLALRIDTENSNPRK